MSCLVAPAATPARPVEGNGERSSLADFQVHFYLIRTLRHVVPLHIDLVLTMPINSTREKREKHKRFNGLPVSPF
jgi:hypothetical protein